MEVKDFSEKNKFIGVFKTSAKNGINISESMEFLIKNIIERLDDISKNNKFLDKDKKSIVLESKTHNKKKGDNCC
jgi:hypothetical protein